MNFNIVSPKSKDELFEEIKDVWGKLEKGEKAKKRTGVYFENLAAFRKALTDKRLELLHTIRIKHPSYIYELSRMLGRNEKNVDQDLSYLKEVGLVELKKSREGRKRTVINVPYEKIQLEIMV